MERAFGKVFRNPRYVLCAAIIAIAIFLFAVWFPNLPLIGTIILSPSITLVEKIRIPLSMVGSISTNFTFFSATYTIAIAILSGIYVAMLIYSIARRVHLVRHLDLATSVLGVMSGIMGIGCASCGALVFAWGFGVLSTGTATAFLPIGGVEFGILGVVLLIISIKLVSRQILNPMVCKA